MSNAAITMLPREGKSKPAKMASLLSAKALQSIGPRDLNRAANAIMRAAERLMPKLNALIATLKRHYENNYKNLNKEKSLHQLQIKRNLRRPARFLHVTPLCPNCLCHNHALIFSGNYGFISSPSHISPTNNLRQI